MNIITMKKTIKVVKRKTNRKENTSSVTQPIGDCPVDAVSYSLMSLFVSNPIMFKLRYIQNEDIPTLSRPPQIIGSAVHYSSQAYLGGVDTIKWDNDSDRMLKAIKYGQDYIESFPDGFIQYSDKIPNKSKMLEKHAFAMNSYFEYLPKETVEQLVDTETFWKGKMVVPTTGEVLPLEVKGRMDIVIRSKDGVEVHDIKAVERFSNEDDTDGSKLIQAFIYYFLAHVATGEYPHKIKFIEIKHSKNADGSPQVKNFEFIYEEEKMIFELGYRLYDDLIKALNGEMVYVPNVTSFYDKDIALIAYINHLDIDTVKQEEYKKHRVENIPSLIKNKMIKKGVEKKYIENITKQFIGNEIITKSNMNTQEKIESKLMLHGIPIHFKEKIESCSVDTYLFELGQGIKVSRIKQFQEDIEIALAKSGIRIRLMPNSSYIGIEVPKDERIFPAMTKEATKDIELGLDSMNEPISLNLSECPHILVAGTTGSGKSVLLKSILNSVESKYIRLVIDPKDELPGAILEEYDIISQLRAILLQIEKKIKNINTVIVIDEYAIWKTRKTPMKDRFENGEVKKYKFNEEFVEIIQKIVQIGRSYGVHIIIATQRPSVDVISGDVKVNFPVRVCLRVPTGTDSKVILGDVGAEKLLGKGDGIIIMPDGTPVRFQGYK